MRSTAKAPTFAPAPPIPGGLAADAVLAALHPLVARAGAPRPAGDPAPALRSPQR